jgi:alpha-tubulin suppressor-like RCC1 family protein
VSGQNNRVSLVLPRELYNDLGGVVNGYGFAIATKTNGTLWSWGRAYDGETGQGDTTLRSSPTQVGSLTNWLSIAAGGYHSVVVKTDGTMWTWGENDLGQLGLGTSGAYTGFSSPKQVGALTTWKTPSAGEKQNQVIKIDGTLWAWGDNADGQLGNGAQFNVSSPAQTGSLNTWLKVGAGKDFSLATKTDGTLWAWGLGGNGALGDNSNVNKSSPIQVGALTTWENLPKMTFAISGLATTKG